MKKLILVLSIISVLFLVGCDTKKNINNDEMDSQTITPKVEDKYKLSDTYYVSGEKLGYDNSLLYLFAKEQKYKEKFDFESDGTDFQITCNPVEESGEISKYDVKINGKEIEFTGENTQGKFGSLGDYMWIIDLDVNDNYKEMVVRRMWGIDSYELDIYRFTKDGVLLLLAKPKHDLEDDLVKIGDKWILTNYLFADVEQYHVIMGYYIYEDGGFKYIEKFATGEDLPSENEFFPENFQKLVFDSDNNGVKMSDIKGRFQFISYNAIGSFTIKLIEDCVRYENGEIIPAGTILEDVGRGQNT